MKKLFCSGFVKDEKSRFCINYTGDGTTSCEKSCKLGGRSNIEIKEVIIEEQIEEEIVVSKEMDEIEKLFAKIFK